MMPLGDLDEMACFLATSIGTDVFSVNISIFLLKELFPDFSSLFTVSCLGYDVITLYQLCVSMCVCIIISGSYRE